MQFRADSRPSRGVHEVAINVTRRGEGGGDPFKNYSLNKYICSRKILG